MFLVLTAANGVRDDIVLMARDQLQGAEAPRRLSDCAVEIRFRGAPPVLELAANAVDCNFVPRSNRQKKLLIADMDSTIIPVECIDELADFAGVKAQVSKITEQVIQGDLNFEAAIDARVVLLKGLPVEMLQKCYDERVSLNPGAKTAVKTMNSLGAMTALVSGGFTFFTSRVAKEVGFQANSANDLDVIDGVLSGTVRRPILGREAKLVELDRLCAEQGITRADALTVGDGANDLMMIESAGLGVAYRAKPALKAAANITLDYSDLTALLSIQGIAESDYVF